MPTPYVQQVQKRVIAVLLWFTKLGANLFIGLIKGYQRFISPMLGPHCRFTPTCSEYGIIALKRFGLIKGSWLTLKRILKCHPLNEGGDDPVPPKNDKQ